MDYFDILMAKKLGGGGDSSVTDVQIEDSSIVVDGVANIPKAGTSAYGVIKANNAYGVETDNTGNLVLKMASDAEIKAGSGSYRPIAASKEDQAVFYGLAKASGDSTQASSQNPVGTYTATAMEKIREMLGIVIIEESDYEALVTPDANTIYLITEDSV